MMRPESARSTVPRTILLATDGSADAALAARAAVSLARQPGTALHVVHAWQLIDPADYAAIATPLPPTYADDLEAAAHKVLNDEARRIARLGGTVAAVHCRLGRPVEVILAVAEKVNAELLVLGSRGHGLAHRLVVGSVAEGVVQLASCPVLVVRGGEQAWPPALIVAGADSSPEAAGAVTLAGQLACALGTAFTLVRALSPLPSIPGETPGALAERRDAAFAAAEADLAAVARRLAGAGELQPTVVVAATDTATLLLDTAASDGPVVLAVGRRGLGGWERLRLGSVSTKLLHAAPGSLLIVPASR
jgi:nucleotide-binding universal stress UspA family protein